MSGEWPVQAATSWKLSLPCTRAEAEAIAAIDLPFPDESAPPVLMTSEPDETAPDQWRLDAYFEGEPTPDLVAAVRALVADAPADAWPEPLPDADWVMLSQASLSPVRAGRFHVHTALHDGPAPASAIAFRIDAGRAFGTGHHQTTTGCLEMLDRMAGEEQRFGRIIDVGTGTGLLAFAARALWPAALVTASDIDPVAIEVAAENARLNAVPTGPEPGRVLLQVADGLDAPALAARAPFDLLVANILAGPLIALAPAFARATMPGGTIVLAGLLQGQAEAVLDAYRAAGFAAWQRIDRDDWPTLAMRRMPDA